MRLYKDGEINNCKLPLSNAVVFLLLTLCLLLSCIACSAKKVASEDAAENDSQVLQKVEKSEKVSELVSKSIEAIDSEHSQSSKEAFFATPGRLSQETETSYREVLSFYLAKYGSPEIVYEKNGDCAYISGTAYADLIDFGDDEVCLIVAHYDPRKEEPSEDPGSHFECYPVDVWYYDAEMGKAVLAHQGHASHGQDIYSAHIAYSKQGGRIRLLERGGTWYADNDAVLRVYGVDKSKFELLDNLVFHLSSQSSDREEGYERNGRVVSKEEADNVLNEVNANQNAVPLARTRSAGFDELDNSLERTLSTITRLSADQKVVNSTSALNKDKDFPSDSCFSIVNISIPDDYYAINIYLSNFAEWPEFWWMDDYSENNADEERLVNWGFWHYALNNDALNRDEVEIDGATNGSAKEIPGEPGPWFSRSTSTAGVQSSIKKFFGFDYDLSGCRIGSYAEQGGMLYEGGIRGDSYPLGNVALVDAVDVINKDKISVDFSVYQISSEIVQDDGYYGMTHAALSRMKSNNEGDTPSSFPCHAELLLQGDDYVLSSYDAYFPWSSDNPAELSLGNSTRTERAIGYVTEAFTNGRIVEGKYEPVMAEDRDVKKYLDPSAELNEWRVDSHDDLSALMQGGSAHFVTDAKVTEIRGDAYYVDYVSNIIQDPESGMTDPYPSSRIILFNSQDLIEHVYAADEYRGNADAYAAFGKRIMEIESTYGVQGMAKAPVGDNIYYCTGLAFARLVDFGDGEQRLVVSYYDPAKDEDESQPGGGLECYPIEVWEYNAESGDVDVVYSGPAQLEGQNSYCSAVVFLERDDKEYLSVWEGVPAGPNAQWTITAYGAKDEGSFGAVSTLEFYQNGGNSKYILDGEQVTDAKKNWPESRAVYKLCAFNSETSLDRSEIWRKTLATASVLKACAT